GFFSEIPANSICSPGTGERAALAAAGLAAAALVGAGFAWAALTAVGVVVLTSDCFMYDSTLVYDMRSLEAGRIGCLVIPFCGQGVQVGIDCACSPNLSLSGPSMI